MFGGGMGGMDGGAMAIMFTPRIIGGGGGGMIPKGDPPTAKKVRVKVDARDILDSARVPRISTSRFSRDVGGIGWTYFLGSSAVVPCPEAEEASAS